MSQQYQYVHLSNSIGILFLSCLLAVATGMLPINEESAIISYVARLFFMYGGSYNKFVCASTYQL